MTMYIFVLNYYCNSPQAHSRSICLSQSAYSEVLKVKSPFLHLMWSVLFGEN